MMDKTGQNPRELPENSYAIYQLKPEPRIHSLQLLPACRSCTASDKGTATLQTPRIA